MNTKMKELKQELKTLAKIIHTTKIEHKDYQRSNQWSEIESTRRSIETAKYRFRHGHIAYCMARGKKYEEIELRVREGNEPNKDLITRILNSIDPVEVADEKAVCASAQ